MQGGDALIDPNQNITARSRDDVGIVPYGVLSEVLGHLRGIATPVCGLVRNDMRCSEPVRNDTRCSEPVRNDMRYSEPVRNDSSYRSAPQKRYRAVPNGASNTHQVAHALSAAARR